MAKSRLEDMGILCEYRGAAITGQFGYRGTGEIDAFYYLDLNGCRYPGGEGGYGFANKEQAVEACVRAGKERLDYMLSQKALEDW